MLARYYAEALFEKISEANLSQAKARLKNFLAFLDSRGHNRLLPSIARELQKVAVRKEKLKTVYVSSRKEPTTSELRTIKKNHKEFFTDLSNIVSHVDKNLIGGFVVKNWSYRLDASHKGALLRDRK